MNFRVSTECLVRFKYAKVHLNPEMPFLRILGKCKSKKCNNQFLGVMKNEPLTGEDLWLEIPTVDTREAPHELIKRQLCNHKREVLAIQAQKEGAAIIFEETLLKKNKICGMLKLQFCIQVMYFVN